MIVCFDILPTLQQISKIRWVTTLTFAWCVSWLGPSSRWPGSTTQSPLVTARDERGNERWQPSADPRQPCNKWQDRRIKIVLATHVQGVIVFMCRLHRSKCSPEQYQGGSIAWGHAKGTYFPWGGIPLSSLYSSSQSSMYSLSSKRHRTSLFTWMRWNGQLTINVLYRYNVHLMF